MSADTTKNTAPTPAWMDEKALEVARRFTMETEYQFRASVQTAVVEAMQFAQHQERKRCYELTMDQPGRTALPGGRTFLYWTDTCKPMAFDLSSRIRAPELYDADGNFIHPVDEDDRS